MGKQYDMRKHYDNISNDARNAQSKYESKYKEGVGVKAKRSISAGLLTMFALLFTSVADHYLGIYAWVMSIVAVLDRFGDNLVTKDFYMYLGLIGLAALVILKVGRASGRIETRRKGGR